MPNRDAARKLEPGSSGFGGLKGRHPGSLAARHLAWVTAGGSTAQAGKPPKKSHGTGTDKASGYDFSSIGSLNFHLVADSTLASATVGTRDEGKGISHIETIVPKGAWASGTTLALSAGGKPPIGGAGAGNIRPILAQVDYTNRGDVTTCAIGFPLGASAVLSANCTNYRYAGFQPSANGFCVGVAYLVSGSPNASVSAGAQYFLGSDATIVQNRLALGLSVSSGDGKNNKGGQLGWEASAGGYSTSTAGDIAFASGNRQNSVTTEASNVQILVYNVDSKDAHLRTVPQAASAYVYHNGSALNSGLSVHPNAYPFAMATNSQHNMLGGDNIIFVGDLTASRGLASKRIPTGLNGVYILELLVYDEFLNHYQVQALQKNLKGKYGQN